jgi:ketosteroid isomerase-like protein
MQAAEAMRAYADAFGRRDVAAAVALFARNALFEMPLLGQRLVGRAEIRAGLDRILLATHSCEMRITQLQALDAVAIGEGLLRADLRADRAPMSAPMSVVVETTAQGIIRLSTYLDAFPHRLWSDGLVAASAGPDPGE